MQHSSSGQYGTRTMPVGGASGVIGVTFSGPRSAKLYYNGNAQTGQVIEGISSDYPPHHQTSRDKLIGMPNRVTGEAYGLPIKWNDDNTESSYPGWPQTLFRIQYAVFYKTTLTAEQHKIIAQNIISDAQN